MGDNVSGLVRKVRVGRDASEVITEASSSYIYEYEVFYSRVTVSARSKFIKVIGVPVKKFKKINRSQVTSFSEEDGMLGASASFYVSELLTDGEIEMAELAMKQKAESFKFTIKKHNLKKLR